MKHVRTYQRAAEEARAALERYPLVITRGDRASLSLAIGLLEDLAAELPAIKRREKARRQRIQWIMVSDRVHVARIGRDVWRVTFEFRTGRAMTVSGRIEQRSGTDWAHRGWCGSSVESASRFIRGLKGKRK